MSINIFVKIIYTYFAITMEQLYFIHAEHDESNIRQVVFHFMNNEILHTLYDVVISNHSGDLLSVFFRRK